MSELVREEGNVSELVREEGSVSELVREEGSVSEGEDVSSEGDFHAAVVRWELRHARGKML